MKAMRFELDRRHQLVWDFTPIGVATLVKLSSHAQTRRRARRGYQADDHRQAYQRLAAPVRADVGEQAVLDLVPLARSGREVAHRDRMPGAVGQLLDLPLPQANAWPVAAASVRGDQQSARSRVHRLSHLPPPPQDGARGEAGRVMVDADADPAGVARQVVDAVGDRLALLRDDEVVDSDRLRGLPSAATVFRHS